MSERRFVFVPIFGSLEGGAGMQGWLKQPHIKVWGFLNPDDDEEITVIHADPHVPAVTIGQPVRLLTEEYRAMIDIEPDSTDLPDEVCLALAKLALMPVSPANQGD